jgi:hypothetical protein
VSESSDEDEALGIIDGVHDPVVAHANAIVVSAGELRHPHRPRIDRQAVDDDSDSIAEPPLEASVFASRRGLQSNFVLRPGPAGYSRTSAHGTAR